MVKEIFNELTAPFCLSNLQALISFPSECEESRSNHAFISSKGRDPETSKKHEAQGSTNVGF